MHYMQDNATVIAGGRGNQAYILAAAPIYDEWIRNNYELRVWQTYLQIGIQGRHWAKEVSTRIKKTTYWTQTTLGALNSATVTPTPKIRDAVDRLEKAISKYIQNCTQHVKNMAENKIRLVQVQMEEYKALH
ncbi:unnamed protein product [Rotaria socialis]|uniref:Uncharacterized protein n=1 Tax=Rotaria socialis TaxID=392032 RepID=A0A817WNL9_9BILA|nr:unnamed protein product [Rotaria socialis]